MSQERRYSFEFFPTKTDAGHEKLLATARQLAAQQPDFFSCTYGAGGSTRDRTLNTVLQLDSEVKVPTAPHLSCVGDSKAELRALLAERGITGANGGKRLLGRRLAEDAAVEGGAGGDVAHVLQQGAGLEHGEALLLGAIMVVWAC